MVKNFAIGILFTIVAGMFFIGVTEFKNYNTCQEQLDILNRVTSDMLIYNFQDKDDMSPYSVGLSMSPNYISYLQFLSSNGMSALSMELQNGYSAGITPANYQVSYLDADKLQDQIQDYIDNYWLDMEVNGTRLRYLITDVQAHVTVDPPQLLTLSSAGTLYFGNPNALDVPIGTYDFNRDRIIDYRIEVRIDYNVPLKMDISRMQAERVLVNGATWSLPGWVTYTEHYSMYN